MAPPQRPCESIGCAHVMHAQTDPYTTADGWFVTTDPKQERRDWRCDHPVMLHTWSETRKRDVREERR
jgi:hypothetical protein